MITIGIIGSGTIGRGIALQAITYGHEVILVDINEKTLNESFDFIKQEVIQREQKNGHSPTDTKAIIGRMYCATSFSSLEKCKLVIECVQEDFQIKKGIFKRVEEFIDKDVIIASSTDSISITKLASTLRFPERFLGLHFFNPVIDVPLIEIIPALQTDEYHLKTCRLTLESWGKHCVLAKDLPGFVVNKIFQPYFSEALKILDDGLATCVEIDTAMTQIGGFTKGPFELMDIIGNDIVYLRMTSLFENYFYDERYRPSLTQRHLYDAGWFGIKTEKGFYEYKNGEHFEHKNLPKDAQGIVDRILCMMINEAADTLQRGVTSKEDIDLAMIKGTSCPKGLLEWADDIGIEKVMHQLDRLFNLYHENRYRCSSLLRKKAVAQSTFYI